jgi:heavy metal sensor kinase
MIARPPSLLRRLVIWQSVALAGSLLALSAVLYVTISRTLRRHHDEDLIRVCGEAGQLVETYDEVETAGLGHLFEHVVELGPHVRLERVEWEDVPEGTRLGKIALSSRTEGQAETERTAPEATAHSHALSSSLRVASGYFELPDYGLVFLVEVSENLGDMDSTLASLRNGIVTIGPLVLLISIGVGAWILRGTLRPLNSVVRSVSTVDAEHFGDRIQVEASTREIRVLVKAFNQMLERLSLSFERLTEFTANASHELRTPLTSLTSNLEVTLEKERPAREYRRVMEEALADVRHLTRIVENLLVMAQTDMAHVKMDTQRVDISALVLDSLDALHVRGAAGAVDLEMDEGEEEEDCLVEGDPHWLRQLFDNLIDNAVKYTPAGGRISVATRLRNGRVEVVFADTGVGIPEEELSLVFERYRRGASTRDEGTRGIGLGLAIAQWVAEAHGGSIEVKSALGEGSEFKVSLPRTR